MQTTPLPSILYKYYPPTGPVVLNNGTIRFSRPDTFNDKFDCDYLVKSLNRKALKNRHTFRTPLAFSV